jgi:hypothetical protein
MAHRRLDSGTSYQPTLKVLAEQRAEIAQQPTDRSDAVLGEFGGNARQLLVDRGCRGLLQLRLHKEVNAYGKSSEPLHWYFRVFAS